MKRSRSWIALFSSWALLAACQGPDTGAGTDSRKSPAETKPTSQPTAAIFDAAVGKTVTASCPPNELYPADGLKSLVDGRMGSDMYEDEEWMGWWYEDKPFDVTIDLGKAMPIRELGVHTLTSWESWILFPRKVEFEVSMDGKTYQKVATVEPTAADLANEYEETKILKASNLQKIARYVRVRAQRYGELPEEHPGAGGADGYEGQAWLFIDEILVNPK